LISETSFFTSSSAVLAFTLISETIFVGSWRAIRQTWVSPTRPRKKLTAARLKGDVSGGSEQRRDWAPAPAQMHACASWKSLWRVVWGKSGWTRNYSQIVLGLDDEAPAGPDDTGRGQSKVLGDGELLYGTGEVRDAGEDEGPLWIAILV
jgi:hypothetical protein